MSTPGTAHKPFACPVCHLSFRGPKSGQAPRRLGCGHNLCVSCVDRALPRCAACQAPIKTAPALNNELSSAAEAAHAELHGPTPPNEACKQCGKGKAKVPQGFACVQCGVHLRGEPSPTAAYTIPSCSHNVCVGCVRGPLLPTCPLCDEVSETVETNLSLASLSEAIYIVDNEAPSVVDVCADCAEDEDIPEASKSEPASFACATCAAEAGGERYLCGDHHRVHKRKRHITRELESKVASALALGSGCVRHPTIPVTRFCWTDGTAVCAECCLADHVPGAGHDVRGIDSDRPALLSRLSELTATCKAGAVELASSSASVLTAKTAMLEASEAACSSVTVDVERLVLALRSHGESIVCGLRGEADARRKALEHQATHLSASSSQLSAAFELGSSILADASAPAHVLAWCVEDVDRLARLYVPVKSLAVPTGITLVNDVASVLRAIKGMSLVTLHRVAPERSVVRGSGARAFIPGDTPLARSTNIVTIACGGEAGGVLTHLGPECVFIGTAPIAPSPGSSSGGSGGAEPVTHATGVNVFDVTVTNGIVTFRYVVDNAALSEVTFTISVDGAKFEPLVVKACTPISGSYAGTILTPYQKSSYGLALSSDCSTLAVSNSKACTVTLFSLPKGEQSGTISGLAGPQRIAFVPGTGNFLVCEPDAKRVREFTVAGDALRMIGGAVMDAKPCGVAASETLVAVGREGNSGKVCVYDTLNGSLLSQFGKRGPASGELDGISGMRFSPDGAKLLVAEAANNRISMFNPSTGAPLGVWGVGSLDSPRDVDFAADGSLVVADAGSGRVCVFSPSSGPTEGPLTSFGSQGEGDAQFTWPYALAAASDRVYVLDLDSPRVLMFN